MKAQKSFIKYDPNNWAWQLKAIMNHDIFKPFGGSPEKAARLAKARTLIVIARQDQLVYPEPARTFGALLKAKTFELGSDCGHFSFLCDSQQLFALVASFLE
jgi:homoserine O-acetyltransferase